MPIVFEVVWLAEAPNARVNIDGLPLFEGHNL